MNGEGGRHSPLFFSCVTREGEPSRLGWRVMGGGEGDPSPSIASSLMWHPKKIMA